MEFSARRRGARAAVACCAGAPWKAALSGEIPLLMSHESNVSQVVLATRQWTTLFASADPDRMAAL